MNPNAAARQTVRRPGSQKPTYRLWGPLLVVGLFLALPMVMLYPLWDCPTSAGEDDVVYYWPLRTMVAGQLRGGHWPGWNAGEAAGVSLAGDPQSAIFFPPNWLFLALPGKTAYSLCIFLAFATAGLGAYVYFRRLNLAAPAVVFGAVAFMFCGFMVGHRVHLGMIQSAAFLPWGFWCIEKVRDGFRVALVRMAPVFALTLAAGHWPTAIVMTLAWAVYLLFRGRPLGRAVLVALVAVVLGAALIAPQVLAVVVNVRNTARAHVPYATVGENSFFPLCSVLAFFPFLMGCRTQNLFGQPWWGPWHLREMLGYVGLVTLVLALGAMRPRRVVPARRDSSGTGQRPVLRSDGELSSLARLWTWMLIGGGIWALGYYLPTYWLIYKLPVIGSVRCPARMLLVLGFALVALAVLTIHLLATGAPAKLSKTVRRAAAIYLPVAMFLALGLIALLGLAEGRWWKLEPLLSAPADGSPAVERLRQAVSLSSPAVFVPMGLLSLTIATLWWVLPSPPRRVWALTGLLLVDLFFSARFVDVPGRGQPMPDPQVSPAAAWLRQHAPATQPYRVLGLASDYHARAAELLQPKTCASLGFESIGYYGPLGPDEYSLLFGFRPWGANENWRWLIRRNHLLSLFNVRYILAAGYEFRGVIESVEVPRPPELAGYRGWISTIGSEVVDRGTEPLPTSQPAGPNLLGDSWSFQNACAENGVIRLQGPSIFSPAWAQQPVRPLEGGVYRISLDIRAPRGAGNFVSAEYVEPQSEGLGWGQDGCLRVDVEQLNANWRHFEWTFEVTDWVNTERRPAGPANQPVFRLFTPSDQPIEVRNVQLRRSDRDWPVNLGGRLKPGDRVYVDRTPEGLPPIRPDDPRVHIYENLLCQERSWPIEGVVEFEDNTAVIEALKWHPEEYDLTRQALVCRQIGPEKPLAFVSENLGGADSGSAVRANGLGAVVGATEVRRPRSPVPSWAGGGAPLQLTALAAMLLAAGACAVLVRPVRPGMNQKHSFSVGTQ